MTCECQPRVIPEVRYHPVRTVGSQLDASGFGRGYTGRYVYCRRDVDSADTGRPTWLPPIMLVQICCPRSVSHTGPGVLVETGGVANLFRGNCDSKALAVRVER